MKTSPKYRLEALRLIKEKAKEKAELNLAKALARLEGERKQLKKLEEEKREIIRRRKEARQKLHEKVASGHALVRDGSYRVHFLQKLEEDEKQKELEIDRQKRVILDCETLVKRARRDYLNTVRELRVIEQHKELWKKKLHLELLRREESEMDELGNVIHQLKKGGVQLNVGRYSTTG